MSDAGQIDDLVARIIDAEKAKMYSAYPKIMTEALVGEDVVQVVSGLAGRLPAGTFQNFFLCNLFILSELRCDEYQRLYASIHKQELAIYNLTLCLVVIGGARGEILRKLCGDCGAVQKIEQFRSALLENPAPAKDDRLLAHYEKAFGVSKAEILSYRKSINSA